MWVGRRGFVSVNASVILSERQAGLETFASASFCPLYELLISLLLWNVSWSVNLHAFASFWIFFISISQAILCTVGILLLKGLPLRFNPSCNRPKVINESSKSNAFIFHTLMMSCCWGAAGVACPVWGWAGSRVAVGQAGPGTSGSRSRGLPEPGQVPPWAGRAGQGQCASTREHPHSLALSRAVSWQAEPPGLELTLSRNRELPDEWGREWEEAAEPAGALGTWKCILEPCAFPTIPHRDGIRFFFFLCIFFILDSSTSGFQWGEKTS